MTALDQKIWRNSAKAAEFHIDALGQVAAEPPATVGRHEVPRKAYGSRLAQHSKRAPFFVSSVPPSKRSPSEIVPQIRKAPEFHRRPLAQPQSPARRAISKTDYKPLAAFRPVQRFGKN
jgi:hypothetical protein